jgi:hypothetical protein
MTSQAIIDLNKDIAKDIANIWGISKQDWPEWAIHELKEYDLQSLIELETLRVAQKVWHAESNTILRAIKDIQSPGFVQQCHELLGSLGLSEPLTDKRTWRQACQEAVSIAQKQRASSLLQNDHPVMLQLLHGDFQPEQITCSRQRRILLNIRAQPELLIYGKGKAPRCSSCGEIATCAHLLTNCNSSWVNEDGQAIIRILNMKLAGQAGDHLLKKLGEQDMGVRRAYGISH